MFPRPLHKLFVVSTGLSKTLIGQNWVDQVMYVQSVETSYKTRNLYETCVQVDHVKDRAKTTHQMCYFCSHDKLRILANNLKRDIRAKDEAIAALEVKLVTISADVKGVTSNEAAKSRSEVQTLVQQVKEKDEMLSQFQGKLKVAEAKLSMYRKSDVMSQQHMQ